MTASLRRLTRLAVAAVALVGATALVPSTAGASPFTLLPGSTISMLGSSYALATPCAGAIAAGGPASCGTWTGTPPLGTTATTTVTGTVNTAGSMLVVSLPLAITFVDPINGDCTVLVPGRTLTYVSGAYRHIGAIGSYAFGSCPPPTQAYLSAVLGPGTSPLSLTWSIA